MESTENTRIWHNGPPPHVGWWNASVSKRADAWRWWDGECWSHVVYEHEHEMRADYQAARTSSKTDIEWTDYWPEYARVPRVDPAQGLTKWKGEFWKLVDGAPMRVVLPTTQVPDTSRQWAAWANSRNQLAKTLSPTVTVDRAELRALAYRLYAAPDLNDPRAVADRLLQLAR